MTTPTQQKVQEDMYRLPYHWFPEMPLFQYARAEKQRIIFDLIRKFLPMNTFEYLDVGCGDGRWTSDIHEFLTSQLKANVSSSGIDFSDQAIGFAKLISPWIDFQVHRGEDIPYPDNCFDLTSTIEVLEHVEDGAEETFLSELRRVTKPEGLVILSTPSWNLKLPPHHFRHYSVERLTSLVETSGFAMLELRGHGAACPSNFSRLRKKMGKIPKLWRVWKYTVSEADLDRAQDLIVALRPKKQ